MTSTKLVALQEQNLNTPMLTEVFVLPLPSNLLKSLLSQQQEKTNTPHHCVEHGVSDVSEDLVIEDNASCY